MPIWWFEVPTGSPSKRIKVALFFYMVCLLNEMKFLRLCVLTVYISASGQFWYLLQAIWTSTQSWMSILELRESQYIGSLEVVCRRLVKDLGTQNLGFKFWKCHGEMGWTRLFFIFAIFYIFDDFSIWSASEALLNFEKPSNFTKKKAKKWRKALFYLH